MPNHLTALTYGERWLRDGLEACGRAGAVEALEVDVTVAAAIIQRLKLEGSPVTWTHVFVQATAMALERNPDLHQIVAGNSRLRPSTVDICLSLAGDSAVTPVLIIEDAARKNLRAIIAEVRRRSPEATKEYRKLVALLNRFGWVVPNSRLRTALIRFLMSKLWYRRKVSGTFQIACLPQVDIFAPLLFNTAAVLGVGRVRDKVVAVNGQPVVRPIVTLACCFDHAQWNGMTGSLFLNALRQVIESGDFAGESLSRAQTTSENSL